MIPNRKIVIDKLIGKDLEGSGLTLIESLPRNSFANLSQGDRRSDLDSTNASPEYKSSTLWYRFGGTYVMNIS
jgi:hypothetical protein